MTDLTPVLRALKHHGPITALKFTETHLLAAFGCVLRVYDLRDFQMVFERQLLAKNKIHGITLKGNQLAVFGGRNVVFTTLTAVLATEVAPSAFQERAVGDWLFCVEFSGSFALLLTAHNVVLEVALDTGRVIGTHTCGEKSILYAGSIRAVEGKEPVVCAGTVMGGILLWNLRSGTLVHTLKGHEGSIFGCEISPDGARIVSCSDDRSIKVWDHASGELLATGWGHGSRIWHLQFFDEASGYAKVYSCSEDLTARIWSLDVTKGTLTCDQTWESHLGRHVWSGDIHEGRQLAASGGADGRLRLHLLETPAPSQGFSMASITEATGEVFAKKEIIKQYVAVASGLLAVSSRGKVFLLHNFTHWVFLFQEDRFVDFAILGALEGSAVATLTDRYGDMLVMKLTEATVAARVEVEETHLERSKIANVLSVTTAGRLMQLVDCPNPKKPYVMRLVGADMQVSTAVLCKPQQTFTATVVAHDALNDWLIVGSRFVTFAVYDLTGNTDSTAPCLFKRLCPGDTISSIQVLESAPGSVLLLVVVKDGHYMYARLTKDDTFSLSIVHKNNLSRGFLEGAFLVNNDLILYGMKSSHFYLWNETKQMEVFSEFCGGAKRQWRLVRTAEDACELRFTFVYSRTDLMVRSFTMTKNPRTQLLSTGTNGREIRSVNASPRLSAGYRLMATASEDATIRLSKLSADGEVENIWQLRAHVSGLQQVKFVTAEYMMSSAAREEFFVWRVTDGPVPYIAECAVLAPGSANPDLRIMDFDAMPVKENSVLTGFLIATVYSDSTIKVFHFSLADSSFTLLATDHYSSCCLWHVKFIFTKETGSFHLLTAGTDGHVALWDLTLMVTTCFTFTACCSADFALCVKNLPSDPMPLGALVVKQAVHQNGIKALELLPCGGKLVVVTGGDDNALGVSHLSLTEGVSFNTTQFLEDAASSTITGVTQIDEGRVMVTSVDQFIRVWALDAEGTALTLVDERYTTVADPGCSMVTTFKDQTVGVVAGAGLSVWGIN